MAAIATSHHDSAIALWPWRRLDPNRALWNHAAMLEILMFATEPFGTWGPGTAGEPSFFSWAYWERGSRSEIVRNLGILALALIGLLFGIWRAITAYLQARASQKRADAANEQARIAQQGHVTERFSQAVEHLGSENLSVRLGGIYALWRLITDSPEDALRVMDVLSAFIRHPPPEPAGPPEPKVVELDQVMAAAGDEAGSTEKLRPDVQTVMNLIGDGQADYRELLTAGYFLDLSHADLAFAKLMDFDLTNAFLAFAKLMQDSLMGANLTKATLIGATLTGANLTGAYLTSADLSDATLTGADLSGASFEGAKNVPPLLDAYANPAMPPAGLPDDVLRPEPWVPRPEE